MLLSSCNAQRSIYKVAKINDHISIDGEAIEKEWSEGTLLKTFSYPWKDIESPATTFRSIHDGNYLYFFFSAEDNDIRLKQTGDVEMDAVASDRVEIFIRGGSEEGPYYSFEMDPLGRVFDSKGEFGKYIDHEYDFPDGGLLFKGQLYDGHYTVEGRLDLAILKELKLISTDGVILMGLYRGEYFLDVDGAEKTNWISWIIPDSPTPNFHIPSSFGKVILQ